MTALGTGNSKSCALAIRGEDAQAHAAKRIASHRAHPCRGREGMAQRIPLEMVLNISSAAVMTLEFIS
jgi:hypothetical protein